MQSIDKQARKKAEAWRKSLSVSQLELIDLSTAPRAVHHGCGSLPPS